jgi:hypothetical protein
MDLDCDTALYCCASERRGSIPLKKKGSRSTCLGIHAVGMKRHWSGRRDHDSWACFKRRGIEHAILYRRAVLPAHSRPAYYHRTEVVFLQPFTATGLCSGLWG